MIYKLTKNEYISKTNLMQNLYSVYHIFIMAASLRKGFFRLYDYYGHILAQQRLNFSN